MTLQHQLDTELTQLAATSGAPLPNIVINEQGGQLVLDLQSVDQLACAMLRMTFRSGSLDGCTLDQLQALAEDLSNRISYLLEPISPVEIDRESCIVQMRSNPPHSDDDGTRYYELVVARGSLSLCRFEKAPTQVRRIVPANVTREVVGRLASDFVAVVP